MGSSLKIGDLKPIYGFRVPHFQTHPSGVLHSLKDSARPSTLAACWARGKVL